MKRWPLHPQPDTYEMIDPYLRRLALCYGVQHRYFLQKILAMSVSELQEYRMEELPPKALQILSNGTGVRLRRLKLMSPTNVWKRIMRDINKTMTPDEIKEFTERFKV